MTTSAEHKPTRILYYGDNLEVLRNHQWFPDECVGLVYLDPPFKSQQDYNLLFKSQKGTPAAAQVQAFTDTWKWDTAAKAEYERLVSDPLVPGRVGQMIEAFYKFLDGSQMMAYLVMMTPLHCDPAASHYLKLVLDTVFGPGNFRNEIVWQRSHPKGHAFTRLARNHDVILAYSKSQLGIAWNPQYRPHDPEKVSQQYSLRDEDGRPYQLTSLLNPNRNRPNLTYEYKGVTRVWRWTQERMLQEEAQGHIVVPKGGKGIPRYKRYLDEQEGVPVDDVWYDIEFASGQERLGYDTQKPLALLRRIIEASSNPGDVVLDPFCGCGTAVVAAEELGRSWIGIDVTYLAIDVMAR
ncbi:MAG: hypothetical protein HW388_200, partial [Dehalococcoidia bacterium]|nr:hypothetical protein [Dehalococcoidia bacterium]